MKEVTAHCCLQQLGTEFPTVPGGRQTWRGTTCLFCLCWRKQESAYLVRRVDSYFSSPQTSLPQEALRYMGSVAFMVLCGLLLGPSLLQPSARPAPLARASLEGMEEQEAARDPLKLPSPNLIAPSPAPGTFCFSEKSREPQK